MRCPSLRRQKRKSAKMRNKMMSLKMKMRERPGAEIRRKSVEAKIMMSALIKMSQLQPVHQGRRRGLEVETLLKFLRLRMKTPIEETIELQKKERKEVVVIEVQIATEVTPIVRIRSAEAETRKREEIVIERRSVVVGMMMTPGTVMQRSVAVKEMMVTVTVTGMSEHLRGRKRMTEIKEIVVIVTVIVIAIGIEVKVKREGNENEA